MNIVVQLRPISGYSIDGGQQSRRNAETPQAHRRASFGWRVL